MTDFSFLADDGLVDALMMEIHGLLQKLIHRDEPGAIDLLGLPLSSSCVETLEKRLGVGEITATLHAAGRSQINETGFPGVWWIRHFDEADRLAAMLIEIARAPHILLADAADIADGMVRLAAATSFATHPRRNVA